MPRVHDGTEAKGLFRALQRVTVRVAMLLGLGILGLAGSAHGAAGGYAGTRGAGGEGGAGAGADAGEGARVVRIPDTGQVACYNASREIPYPAAGAAYYGQDGQYASPAMAFRDNGDGTVSDLVTGLTWTKGIDLAKVSLIEAKALAAQLALGGHGDWRVPNIKEMYSLIDFRGYTGFPGRGGLYSIPSTSIPYIDTDFFDFAYGQVNRRERYIDAQWLTTTEYVSKTMGGADTLFGVNFADGRIKGYPSGSRNAGGRSRVPGPPEKKFYVRFVRGPAYGHNQFVDNGDGSITDQATGMTWQRADSGRAMSWRDALAYAEGLSLGGHDDWRLPNAKELQYLVDYTRSPDTTQSPAIDPIFQSTPIRNEAGQADYGFYWTSTTHLDGPTPGGMACYISFGRAIGQMRGRTLDVHGAGAQRSDPKVGQPVLGHGPQGDARRVYNFVRCVRGGEVSPRTRKPEAYEAGFPSVVRYKDTSSGQFLTRKPTTATATPTAGRGGRGAYSRQGQEGGGTSQGNAQGGTALSNGRASAFVSRLDKDGDGRVSRSEFDGPSQHFPYLDKNQDGYLSAEEAPPPPRGR